MHLPLDDIYCLDFEASGLHVGSYPIEVAVADCASGDCIAWLIKPTHNWISSSNWDSVSEKIHNITREELLDRGLPVEQVAQELSQHCKGKVVLADGGEHDRYWLRTLFEATGVPRDFTLDDYAAFARDLAVRSGRRPDLALANSEIESQIRFPRTHRAAADARSLAEALRLIAGWP